MGSEQKKHSSTKELLQKKYSELQSLCKIGVPKTNKNINAVIKKALYEFVQRCNNPAIWCYGKHTKMLMADFMFELKKVHCIIDNGIKSSEGSGFEIIDEHQIEKKGIDGIIISSKVYKDEIVRNLEMNYRHIPYLDIYDVLEKEGIELTKTYYEAEHPYEKYFELNRLQNDVLNTKDKEKQREGLKKIIENYIVIKDFRSAIYYAKKLAQLSQDVWVEQIVQQLEELYYLQREAFGEIDKNNVLMLCIDGLRRKEVSRQYMANLDQFIQEHMHYYCNAYAMSTSTYESLLPTYSQNTDLRTRYYETDIVPAQGCPFINEAKKQGRTIFFYTDGVKFIEDETIIVTLRSQTATEKLWDFLMDAYGETNGLFYVHILYESHYSYPNPYTNGTIIAEGTNILFDYLDKNGRQIRTDYCAQQKDALHYVDDIVIPLIERLPCRMVLYADHGNLLLNKETKLSDIEETAFTFHEDLIQIPLAIKSPEMEISVDSTLISLEQLNRIVICLMNKQSIEIPSSGVIKVLRSEIYNPDFRYLYTSIHKERSLLAFETFIFEEGYKLAIFADGTVEVYCTKTDCKLDDMQCKKALFRRIEKEITVCKVSDVHW